MFTLDMLFLLAVLAFSIFLIGFGLPLLNGWIKPNALYGIRNTQTFRDPQAWYAANRVAGFWIIATGVATAGVSTAMYAAGIPIPFCLFFTSVTVVAGVIVMALQSDNAARRQEVPKLHLQFRILSLFIVTTLVAIGCAIARLPAPWLFKIAVLFAYIVCILGLTTRTIKPPAPKPD